MNNSKVIANIDTMVALKPHSIVLSKRWNKDEKQTQTNEKSLDNLLKDGARAEDMNGYLSDASRRALKSITENFLTAVKCVSNFKYDHPSKVFPTFITLTLPFKQLHSDELIKRECLDPFIKWLTNENTYVTQKGKSKGLQQGCNVKFYVWRAETQKNGNLHFHLVVDRWIDKDQILWRWNQIIERLKYVTYFGYKEKDKYRNGFTYEKGELEAMQKSIEKKVKYTLASKQLPDKLNEVLHKDFNFILQKNKALSKRRIEALAIEVLKSNYERKKAEDFKNPPSTQVIQIANKNSVSAYITKYIAKPQEEYKPNLKKNQKLEVEVNAKGQRVKYITTYRELGQSQEIEEFEEGGILTKYVCTYTYEGDMKFLQKREEYIISREEYKPVFTCRKVRGRIWGRADVAKEYCFKPHIVKAKNFTITDVEKEIQYTTTRKVTRAVENTDIFGNVTTKLQTQTEQKTYIEYEVKRQYKETPNLVVVQYLDAIRAKVPQKEIEEATAKVGGTFKDFGGEIIPIYEHEGEKVKGQLEFLEELSPDLLTEYRKYYETVFQNIYNCHVRDLAS